MGTFKFKRTLHVWEWDTDKEPQKGYQPYYEGEALPYLIQYDDFLKDWSVWKMEGKGDHVCGGLTYAEAKEAFSYYYQTRVNNFYGEQ
jgi:hypothetical protein